MTRGLVDAILVAIRDASVAEIGHSSGAVRGRPGPSAGARPRSRADVAPAAAAPRPAAAKQAGRARRASAEPKPVGPVRAAIARRQARASAAGRADARAWDDGPDAGGGTAITDPESVLAAFGGEAGAPRAAARPTDGEASHVDAHAGAGASGTRTAAAAGSASAASPSPGASAGPARPSLPALRENETALRTAGGGTVIRRKRSPVRAA